MTYLPQNQDHSAHIHQNSPSTEDHRPPSPNPPFYNYLSRSQPYSAPHSSALAYGHHPASSLVSGQTEITAVASAIVAVLNLIIGPFIAMFVPVIPAVIVVLTIVLGHIGLSRCGRHGTAGADWAVLGLVVSYFSLFLAMSIVGLTVLFFGGLYAVTMGML